MNITLTARSVDMLTDVSRGPRLISTVCVPIWSPLRMIAKRSVSVDAPGAAFAPNASARKIATVSLTAPARRRFVKIMCFTAYRQEWRFVEGKFGLLGAARDNPIRASYACRGAKGCAAAG